MRRPAGRCVVTQREAIALAERLQLKPHPEGGFYAETFRSDIGVQGPWAARAAMTSIYYLLSAQNFSAFHRVRSDEIWHHYAGAPVIVEIIDRTGNHRGVTIGDGNRWQCAVTGGQWFAAHVLPDDDYALVGCDVAPGFAFEDFELAERASLLASHPEHRAIIERYTRR